MSSPFSPWESFYVIVGSSAAALTGLQFVVMTIGAENRMGSGATTSAYGTPTVVHFCAVLLVSAIVSAPWPGLMGPAVAIALAGVAGALIALLATRHAQRQTDYKPVLEDWIFHTILPLLAYLTLIAGGFLLSPDPEPALFAIGGAALLLLFVGIHNAWDAVVYLAQRRGRRPDAGPG
jgi:hypothetical protein